MNIKRVVVYLSVILVFLFVGYISNKPVVKIEPARVNRIIDGDTIETNISKVRLLGINTPEKHRYLYNESKNFLSFLEDKKVKLIRYGEDTGVYGRKLRYIYYKDRFINKEILEKGLGYLYLYEKRGWFNKYIKELQKAENNAKKSGLGLWERSKNKCSNCIKLYELNEIEEYLIIKNICDFSCNLDSWTIKDNANHYKILDFTITSGDKKIIQYSNNVWNNDGDRLYLRDNNSLLALFYEY